MKKHKIIFWISTGFIFLFEGLMPALTSHTDVARESIRLLGYPTYFGMMLTFFKVAGSVVLIVPQFSRRLKEWAYAGFTFDFIAASISNGVVFGIGFFAFFPIIILSILMISYIYYHKLLNHQLESPDRAGFTTLQPAPHA
jgi:fatty acid desaturase